jgi:hypothetical protein
MFEMPYQELGVSARSVKDEETESSFGETTFKLWGDVRRKNKFWGDDFQALGRLVSSIEETKIKFWGDDFQALGRRKPLKRLINKGDLLSRLYRLF